MIGAGAVALAALLEFLAGEPPQRIHPVAHFGRLIAPLDRAWRRPRLVGLVGALACPLLAAGIVGGLVTAVGTVWPWLAAIVAGLALFVSTSLRMLVDEARATVAATTTDLEAARSSLRALAGRDPSALSAGQVRSAAVESAAENLADGLVAPLGAFGLGVGIGTTVAGPTVALALGAATAVWVKAINTLDSMLGYRSKPVGWASARLDDIVMWLPARASAALLAVATRDPRALARARSLLEEVPSPNSGWPMGTLATAHDTRLEKPGVYAITAGEDLPSRALSERAIRTVAIAGGLAYGLLFLVALLVWVSG